MVCSYSRFYRCSIYYNLYYNTAIKAVKNGVTEENKNKIKHVFKPYFNCISAVLQLLSRIFIYVAALSGISPELYEACTVDGANRLQKIRYLEIPSILPTVVIVLILNTGSIMNLGFEKVPDADAAESFGVGDTSYLFI